MSAAAPGVVLTAEAHNPLSTLSAWTTFPPRINGLDDCFATFGGGCTSEWANAATSFFDLSWNDPNGLSGKIHMMNDAINLYIAVEIYNDDKDPLDCVTLLFDNNHGGPLSGGGAGKQDGDDLLIVCGDSTFNDLYAVGGGQLGDTSSGGTIDGAGRAGYAGGVWWFEMVHPLDTSDNSHDFSLSLGQTVGFSLIYQENGGSPITPATNVISERDYKVSGCTEPDGSGCSFGLFGTTRDHPGYWQGGQLSKQQPGLHIARQGQGHGRQNLCPIGSIGRASDPVASVPVWLSERGGSRNRHR